MKKFKAQQSILNEKDKIPRHTCKHYSKEERLSHVLNEGLRNFDSIE